MGVLERRLRLRWSPRLLDYQVQPRARERTSRKNACSRAILSGVCTVGSVSPRRQKARHRTVGLPRPAPDAHCRGSPERLGGTAPPKAGCAKAVAVSRSSSAPVRNSTGPGCRQVLRQMPQGIVDRVGTPVKTRTGGHCTGEFGCQTHQQGSAGGCGSWWSVLRPQTKTNHA